jgi:hypothetical protein
LNWATNNQSNGSETSIFIGSIQAEDPELSQVNAVEIAPAGVFEESKINK